MPLETARHYLFAFGGILANAPRASGVYALYSGEELSYVDVADSIYNALLDHWDRLKTAIDAQAPTSFAFERCNPEMRGARLAQLVLRCRPPHTGHPELLARER